MILRGWRGLDNPAMLCWCPIDQLSRIDYPAIKEEFSYVRTEEMCSLALYLRVQRWEEVLFADVPGQQGCHVAEVRLQASVV
jgi:hypothetical protein